MLTSPTSIASRIAFLLAGVALLLAGCDVVSQQSEEKKVTYEVTNDLAERLTVAGQNGAKAAAPAKSTSFTIIGQILPPDVAPGSERASHVHFNDIHDKLYAGYMIRGDGPGNGFGGGVDIIDVSTPSSPDPNPPGSNVNALQVNGVDIQESASTRDFLLLGVAEEESFDIGNTPSEIHSIHIDPGDGTPESSGGTVDFDDRDLPGDLVKGVTNAPPSDGTHDFYAITDANTLHQISVGGPGVITGLTTDETSPPFTGVEFRGLTANGAAGWAMDDGGNIWAAPTGGGLVRMLTFPTPDFFDEDPTDDFGPLDTIARVTSPGGGPTCGGETVLFAALNNDGFRVIKTAGSGAPAEVFESGDFPVTSVTATSDFVYVASGRQMALYSVESGICDETDTDAGLRRIGLARISSFDDASSFDFSDRGQVNEIVVDERGPDTFLYIAKGDDGVFILEQDAGSYP